ncbi:MAG: dockerin type I repeat-containing protein, partial [Chloroflexota bacterium]
AQEIVAEWTDGSVHITDVVPGDATGDGVVNSSDITKVERIMLMLDPETPGADANGDGVVNSSDITRIERIMLQLD